MLIARINDTELEEIRLLDAGLSLTIESSFPFLPLFFLRFSCHKYVGTDFDLLSQFGYFLRLFNCFTVRAVVWINKSTLLYIK